MILNLRLNVSQVRWLSLLRLLVFIEIEAEILCCWLWGRCGFMTVRYLLCLLP